jgi:hypothetical protein
MIPLTDELSLWLYGEEVISKVHHTLKQLGKALQVRDVNWSYWFSWTLQYTFRRFWTDLIDWCRKQDKKGTYQSSIDKKLVYR